MSRHGRGYTVRGGGTVPIHGLSKASAKNMTTFAKGTKYYNSRHKTDGSGFPCLVMALVLCGVGAIGVGLFGLSLMWFGL